MNYFISLYWSSFKFITTTKLNDQNEKFYERLKFEQLQQHFLDPSKNRDFEKFLLPRSKLSLNNDSSVKMGREEEKNKKKRKKKKRKRIRSNPSAHLPVIKTYNSRQPSAKPCPRPLSYLSSSSLLPSPLAPRQSASSFSSSPYASHRMPSCIFHTLYRNYFIALPWISASLHPWGRGEEGRILIFLSTPWSEYRIPNFRISRKKRKRLEFRSLLFSFFPRGWKSMKMWEEIIFFFSFFFIFKDEVWKIFANDQFVSFQYLRLHIWIVYICVCLSYNSVCLILNN